MVTTKSYVYLTQNMWVSHYDEEGLGSSDSHIEPFGVIQKSNGASCVKRH